MTNDKKGFPYLKTTVVGLSLLSIWHTWRELANAPSYYPDIKPTHVDELVINTDPEKRTIAALNETEGLHQLQDKLTTAQNAEIWSYISTQTRGSGRWVELGRWHNNKKELDKNGNEQLTGYDMTPSYPLMTDLIAQNSHQTVYFFHPSFGPEHAMETFASSGELEMMLKWHQEATQAGSSVDFNVVSKQGTTSYTIPGPLRKTPEQLINAYAQSLSDPVFNFEIDIDLAKRKGTWKKSVALQDTAEKLNLQPDIYIDFMPKK